MSIGVVIVDEGIVAYKCELGLISLHVLWDKVESQAELDELSISDGIVVHLRIDLHESLHDLLLVVLGYLVHDLLESDHLLVVLV